MIPKAFGNVYIREIFVRSDRVRDHLRARHGDLVVCCYDLGEPRLILPELDEERCTSVINAAATEESHGHILGLVLQNELRTSHKTTHATGMSACVRGRWWLSGR